VIRLFVTGTDTDVGKTYVSAALLREGVRRGWSVLGFKPIETGCAGVAADARELSVAAARVIEPMYALEYPAAPSVAAAREGVVIELGPVVARAHELAAAHDLAIVEGAGGWRVPITETEDMAELAALLGWPVLIVARAGLGTINHTLLTVEAVARRCVVHGVVLSVRPTDDQDRARSNRDEIAHRTPAPVWMDPLEALPPA